MGLTFQELMLRLTLVPVLGAALIGGIRFRHLPRNLRCLAGGIICFLLPLEAIGLLLLLQHSNNLFLIPIYTVGELGLLATLYRYTLCSIAFTRLLPWLIGGFACYSLADILLKPGLLQFRPGQQVVQSVLVLGMVGWYFRKLLHELNVQQLRREPMFWVSTGLFIYFTGYLLIALFSNYLLHYSDQLNMNIWTFHAVLFDMLYGCYCAAFLVREKP